MQQISSLLENFEVKKGKIITEFVGLRANVLINLVNQGDEKVFIKVDILMTVNHVRHKLRAIINQSHNMYSVTVAKISLSPFDDKDT